MNDLDLQTLAKTVIEEKQGLFEQVNEISKDLQINNNIQDIDRYYSHQDTLTGLYGQLNIDYKKMCAMKKNLEVGHYTALKLQADQDNTKFVSAVAEQYASHYVAPIREVRNILEGYIEIIIKAIETCRSHIYSFEKDRKYDV